MMRRTIVTILMLLSGAAAFAEAVPQSLAQRKAEEFLSCSQVTLARTGAPLDGVPSYYVFNSGNGGWVMISGDDSLIPVLAYSDEGCFPSGELPGNISGRLGLYEKQVKANRNARMRGDSRIRAMWSSPQHRTKAGMQMLITTAEWDQGAPYNASCPTLSGDTRKPPVGCIATALAITMRNNISAPFSCSGTLEGYKVGRTTIPSINLDGKSFDMSVFSLKGMGSWTSGTYKKSLQDLLYYLGVAVKMQYGADGSSAFEDDILPSLTVHFGISDDAMLIRHYNYSDYDWFRRICRELDEGRVVPYFGSDEDTGYGHAFVCDGYDDSNRVHINWGWSGECNGWFAITKLGPVDGNVFSDYDDALIGFQSGKGGKKLYNELYLWSGSVGSEEYYGMSLESGKVERNSEFKVRLGYICNDEPWAYDGKIRIALLNSDGEVREVVGGPVELHIDGCGSEGEYIYPGCAVMKNISCKFTAAPEFGDRIAAQFSLPEGSWTTLGCDRLEDGTTPYVGVTEYCALKTDSEYNDGDVLYFDILYGHKSVAASVWYLDGKRQDETYTILKKGQHTLKAEIDMIDGSRETIEQKINVR